MLALSIDTSQNFLSLALQNGDKVASTHLLANQKHAELILPELRKLLDSNGVDLKNLDVITYAQGPGSFTGLRIGAGVAQGLAFAHDIPLMGIPTLDVLACISPEHEFVLCAIDARMNEVFFAWYNTITGTRLSDYSVDKPENINVLHKTAIGFGNAFTVYENMPIKGEDKTITAEDYLLLITTNRYPKVKAEDAELLYVRNKIALTTKEQAQRKAEL